MQRDSLEPAGQPEPPSELLRIGKDEMNLAEFPLTLLSDRAAADQRGCCTNVCVASLDRTRSSIA